VRRNPAVCTRTCIIVQEGDPDVITHINTSCGKRQNQTMSMRRFISRRTGPAAKSRTWPPLWVLWHHNSGRPHDKAHNG
jgi:hypothetical protein